MVGLIKSMGGGVVNGAEYNDGCLNMCGGEGGRAREATLGHAAVLAPAARSDSLASGRPLPLSPYVYSYH